MNDSRYVLKKRVSLEAESEDSQEGVVIDTHSASMFSCNGTAWHLMKLLRTGATVEQLALSLSAHFAVEDVDPRADALEFVRTLSTVELVDEIA